jgi:hypothetical protein
MDPMTFIQLVGGFIILVILFSIPISFIIVKLKMRKIKKTVKKQMAEAEAREKEKCSAIPL